jgi:hypothetical protein
MDVQTSQEKFLSNDQNKIRLIAILTEKLLNSGVGVIQAEDDADTFIVQIAIQNTQNYRKVIVIGEDIDLIVLLLILSTSQSDQIVFLKPGKGKMETKFYSIQTLKEQFQNMILHFMFIHAISGCDITSLKLHIILFNVYIFVLLQLPTKGQYYNTFFYRNCEKCMHCIHYVDM